jgi:voltage-gated potassium channel
MVLRVGLLDDTVDEPSEASDVRMGTRVPDPRDQFKDWLRSVLGIQRVGLVPPVLLLVMWLIVGTSGYMVIEGWSAFDSVYMSVITLSTVGFQEVHPLSTTGRAFTSVLVLAGLGTVFYAFTSIGQMVVEGELADILGRRRMRRELRELEDHYIVCGYGRTSRPVVEGLEQSDRAFCVIDKDEEIEDELSEAGFVYLVGDATEENVLETAGIDRARGLLALLPSDPDNLYLTMTAKNMNPDVRVIARASDDQAATYLHRGGADDVVSPYETAGNRVLQTALKPAVVELMELATPREHLQLSLEEVAVEADSPLDGRTIKESEIRRRCGVIIVAIKRANGQMTFNPDPKAPMERGDHLVALGEGQDLETLAKLSQSR